MESLKERKKKIVEEMRALEKEELKIKNLLSDYRKEIIEINTEMFPIKLGTLYYYINSEGIIKEDIWGATEVDVWRYENCILRLSLEEIKAWRGMNGII